MKRFGVLLCAAMLAGAARYETSGPDTEAFIQPIEGLDGEHAASFRKGSGIFRQAWVIGPSQDHPDFIGLGPLYNRLSCIACHVKNGRGAAPDSENGVARTMAARLSVEGKDAHGGPRVHPDYGAQLNPEGVPGVAGEGQAVVEYAEFDVALSDGATVRLRRPTLSFRNLAYGPLGPETKTSLRNAPPVFGLGLLEAVTEAEILAGAGRPNFVFSVETGQRTLGRFGLKANQPNLKQQIANAFVEDIGVTSSLFPAENCPPSQSECRRGASTPELTDAQLDAVVNYIRALAPPAAAISGTRASRTATFCSMRSAVRTAIATRCMLRTSRCSPRSTASRFIPTPTFCCTTWATGSPTAATTSRLVQGTGARRRSGDWASPAKAETAPIFCTTAGRARSSRRSSGTAAKRNPPPTPSAIYPEPQRDALLAFLNSL